MTGKSGGGIKLPALLDDMFLGLVIFVLHIQALAHVQAWIAALHRRCSRRVDSLIWEFYTGQYHLLVHTPVSHIFLPAFPRTLTHPRALCPRDEGLHSHGRGAVVDVTTSDNRCARFRATAAEAAFNRLPPVEAVGDGWGAHI